MNYYQKPKKKNSTLFIAKYLVPEMVGGVVGIYNGKEFTNVEIKFDMIGKYLAEFAITYKPTKHGKPGVGATKGSQHVDKK
jgi:small subunit ribosomal protein S15e